MIVTKMMKMMILTWLVEPQYKIQLYFIQMCITHKVHDPLVQNSLIL